MCSVTVAIWYLVNFSMFQALRRLEQTYQIIYSVYLEIEPGPTYWIKNYCKQWSLLRYDRFFVEACTIMLQELHQRRSTMIAKATRVDQRWCWFFVACYETSLHVYTGLKLKPQHRIVLGMIWKYVASNSTLRLHSITPNTITTNATNPNAITSNMSLPRKPLEPAYWYSESLWSGLLLRTPLPRKPLPGMGHKPESFRRSPEKCLPWTTY